ncbi:hypothetical protein MSPP1_000848 [Malassezia sp. CBS 17886]|nr:hypothetical protein MSPP1_000848 [Malassezia sp. CBS 17886]
MPENSARESARDECGACLLIAGHAHSEHPLRRVVLGPLPVAVVSSETLMTAARRQDVQVDDVVQNASGRSGSMLRPGFLRSVSRRRTSFLAPLRVSPQSAGGKRHGFGRRTSERVATPRSRMRSGAATTPSQTPVPVTESPEVIMSPDTRTDKLFAPPSPPTSTEISRSELHAPFTRAMESVRAPFVLEPPPPPRSADPRRPQHETASAASPALRRTLQRRRLPTGGSVGRHSGDSFSRQRHLSLTSVHSRRPTLHRQRDPHYRWLRTDTREALEDAAALVVDQHRYIGHTFVVGDAFWQHLYELDRAWERSGVPLRPTHDAGPPGASHTAPTHTPRRSAPFVAVRAASMPPPGPRAKQARSVATAGDTLFGAGEERGDTASVIELHSAGPGVQSALSPAVRASPEVPLPARDSELTRPTASRPADEIESRAGWNRTVEYFQNNSFTQGMDKSVGSMARGDPFQAGAPSGNGRSGDAPSAVPPPSRRASRTGTLTSIAPEAAHAVGPHMHGPSALQRLPGNARSLWGKVWPRAPPGARDRAAAPTAGPALTRTPSLESSDAEAVATRLVALGEPVPVGQGDQTPPRASDVLSRAADTPVPTAHAKWHLYRRADARGERIASLLRPVLKRDRMLVKVQLTPSVDVPHTLDDQDARRLELRSYRWTEYIVALRSGRLELWSEATFRGRILGDTEMLKLRYVVPLTRGETFVSLYSEVDRLFCVSFPKQSTREGGRPSRFPFRHTGTMILLFSARAFSMAMDWLWILWRELGGAVPDHVFVHVPDLSVRVRIPIPALPNDVPGKEREYGNALTEAPWCAAAPDARAFPQLMQQAMTDAVNRTLREVPNWAYLGQRLRSRGTPPRLAWRSGHLISWVLRDDTVEGAARYWNVLAGSLLTSQRRLPTLELSPSLHYPTDTLHPNGTLLTEPAGVEGFVLRLRAVSGATQRVYLSTQNSLLFLLRESRAFTPDEFAGVPVDADTDAGSREQRMQERADAFLLAERERLVHQMHHADGFVDLRDVVAIRSVGTGRTLLTDLTKTATDMASLPALAQDDVRTMYDYKGMRSLVAARLAFPPHAAAAGDAGLAHAAHRTQQRALRQLELVLNNGQRIFFECFSSALAEEWGVRLFELATYWLCRRKMDAWMAMAVSGESTLSKITPGRHTAEFASLALRFMWNWCNIEGCRAIRHSGRLYWRTHRRHPFCNNFFVLGTGSACLVAYRLASSTRTAAQRQNEGSLHVRLEAPIMLRDAYVYTGKIGDRPTDLHADESMPTARRRANAHSTTVPTYARLYRDGLSSSDKEDDCTFVLRVRTGYDALSAQQNAFRLRHGLAQHQDADIIPGLSDKTYGEIIFRARSMVERDIWIRAISLEIEEITRAESDREQKVRERGRVW